MNLATLIGLLLGTALIGTAAFLGASDSNQPISVLVELNSFLIVLGGSLAATAIAYKMKDVARLLGLLKMIFKQDSFTLGDVVDDMCDLAASHRSSRKEFEAALQASPQNMKQRLHMVNDGAELILGGSKHEDIESIM